MRKSDHDYATARHLRRTPTLPEGLLWRELRRQSGGVKIRRQHPVGAFVIDFYCAAAKLGIEIDGMAHAMGSGPARDDRRAEFLSGQGITLIRLPARDVLADPLQAAESIVAPAGRGSNGDQSLPRCVAMGRWRHIRRALPTFLSERG